MSRFALTRKVAILGIIANIGLLIIKLIVGFMSKSQAMIADGFNSAGDVFASTVTFIGNKISSQPKDHDHPYGHGKAEYIFSMIISFSLFLVAFSIFRSSLNSILQNKSFEFSVYLVAVAIITIVLKFFLFLYTHRAGKKEENLLITANSEDHRNDIFLTTSTLIGIIFGYNGIFWVDGVVGIAISLWIAFTGARIFISCYKVLMDTDIDKVLKADVVKAIETTKGVEHIDEVKAKPVGISFIIIVKVSVLKDLTVEEGHSVAARIKENLKTFKHVSDVIVHINPA
ncbi:cation diffusion facilitator family transporter [Herbivorax sp. ANBcel31]|uniref:cation diffusion facilitator family transporter n=1 Tax=Herbivorax sp. ANBcel31 TaxID=3069754 RepID=UPI0027B752E8|nr:cation diffusion facilitator family transporter [Herbivorax sp. ANBcel31]MDQ2085678.1 cation diffusion facilitator family transporter [Herbivorax sp. ANBcel31]